MNYRSLLLTPLFALALHNPSAFAGETTPVVDPKTPVPVEEPEKADWGKINVNIRVRYEYGDQQALDSSNAFTGRLRLGYTTPEFYGFQAMAEFEGTLPADTGSYRAANIDGPADKTVIADPKSAELNRLWLAYKNWDSIAKVGRQRIILDNARFIGNVGWRQNEQTFDAVFLSNQSIEGLSLTYGYLNQVIRIFGSESYGPTDNFDSDSHIANVSYKINDAITIAGYAYLLDLNNDVVLSSTQTYGGYLTGKLPLEGDFSLGYRGEFAWQSDYKGNPIAYGAPYYHVALDAGYQKLSFGLGYEVLGSDGGVAAFQTPLGTNHAFNGFADRFLTTPAGGLRDLYASVGYKLPWGINAKAIYHYFWTDDGGDTYGQEADLVAFKAINENWKAVTKFAYYFGNGGGKVPAAFGNDTVRFSIEINYKF